MRTEIIYPVRRELAIVNGNHWKFTFTNVIAVVVPSISNKTTFNSSSLQTPFPDFPFSAIFQTLASSQHFPKHKQFTRAYYILIGQTLLSRAPKQLGVAHLVDMSTWERLSYTGSSAQCHEA